MNVFSGILAIAMMIAFGLAFSPEVSADHNVHHPNIAPGQTGEPPPGCNVSPVVNNPQCFEN
jgi:hypothetical protein